MTWSDPSWKTAAREYHVNRKARQYGSSGNSSRVNVFPENSGNSNGKAKAGLAIKLTFFDESCEFLRTPGQVLSNEVQGCPMFDRGVNVLN